MASAKKKSNSRSQSESVRTITAGARVRERRGAIPTKVQHFAICIRNDDYRASLELRKLYPILDDPFASEHAMVRIIDESGEDYLYPASYFAPIDLPAALEQTLQKIA